MVKEDFARGGGVPLPCSTGGLPGGVASMSFAWTGMASETYTHSREELEKKKSTGDPMSFMVNCNEECCSRQGNICSTPGR